MTAAALILTSIALFRHSRDTTDSLLAGLIGGIGVWVLL